MYFWANSRCRIENSVEKAEVFLNPLYIIGLKIVPRVSNDFRFWRSLWSFLQSGDYRQKAQTPRLCNLHVQQLCSFCATIYHLRRTVAQPRWNISQSDRLHLDEETVRFKYQNYLKQNVERRSCLKRPSHAWWLWPFKHALNVLKTKETNPAKNQVWHSEAEWSIQQ